MFRLESVAAKARVRGPDAERRRVRGASVDHGGSFPLDLSEGRGQLDGLDRMEGLDRLLARVWGDSLDRHG